MWLKYGIGVVFFGTVEREVYITAVILHLVQSRQCPEDMAVVMKLTQTVIPRLIRRPETAVQMIRMVSAAATAATKEQN